MSLAMTRKLRLFRCQLLVGLQKEVRVNPEFWSSLVTFLVGLVALVVYWLTKRAEKRNAATIVVMDIRHAEQVVLSILEKGVVDRTIKNILSENNWAKYKHLFASDFSLDDFSAFNRFFEACAEISDARRRMVEIFYVSLNEKSAIMQQKLFSADICSAADKVTERAKVIDAVNQEQYVFDPEEPKVRILQSLQLMGRLSNTVAFEKLKKQAGIKS